MGEHDTVFRHGNWSPVADTLDTNFEIFDTTVEFRDSMNFIKY